MVGVVLLQPLLYSMLKLKSQVHDRRYFRGLMNILVRLKHTINHTVKMYSFILVGSGRYNLPFSTLSFLKAMNFIKME